MKRVPTLLAVFLLTALSIAAQTTKVKGRVTDADTGEGIPFASVFFDGTTVGVSADMDGYYTLETRDPKAMVLTANMMGFDSQSFVIVPGAFSEVDFSLHLIVNRLDEVVIRPDDRRIRRLLAGINANRDRHNPEKREAYQCDLYTKVELDMTNAETYLGNRMFRKHFGFVFDYMDTSVVSGQPYLPVMISETVARRYHTNTPALDKEVIEATRISGLNEENAVSQFTGSLHLRANFYDNFINAFDVEIPSPLSPNGRVYYNYYLIDSLQIEGRKTYLVRYHPKSMVSSPTFDGEMFIDAEDYGLRTMHASLRKGSNVNWIRDLKIDVENQRVGDTAWFYLENKLYADFSLTLRDSSKMMSFLGNRTIHYANPKFSIPNRKELVAEGENVMIRRDAGRKDADYWADARPYDLSEREQGIYDMVEQIQDVPIYNNIVSVVTTFVKGYYNIGKIGIGPYSQLVSFNEREGFRPQLGLRTTSEFSRWLRLTGYLAYGTKDRDFKGMGQAEIMFSNQPTRKITATLKRDYVQLGKSSGSFSESNILTSLFSKSGFNRRSYVNAYSVFYEHEFNPGFVNRFGLEFTRIFHNDQVPLRKQDGTVVTSVGANQLHYSARFSWDETTTRGVFDKYYVHTKYPVVSFDITGSLKAFDRYDYTFLRTEMGIRYRVPTPPAGYGRLYFNAGHIFGNVPYPLLKLHEGNSTYFLDTSAFNCMDYYEFASDTWATLMYEHNFGGFFLGKIPLLKRLQLREVGTFKMAYGTISDHNNGIVGNDKMREATLLFPEGMSDLNRPYIEMGVGVSNILRIIRVDFFWRMTHRYHEVDGEMVKVPHLFAVNVGMQLSF